MPERPVETVLIVDDERGPRDSLRMILQPAFRVLSATSAQDALAILRSEPIDIVTLDIKMPGMSGQDLMRRMHDEFPNTEIIVVTGCGSIDSAAESVRFGICDYLQKPFDVVQVSAAVARAVARQRARTRLRVPRRARQGRRKDRDATAILPEVERSQKLRGRLSGLFGARRHARGQSRGPARLRVPRSARGDDREQGSLHARARAARRDVRRAAGGAGLASAARTRSSCGSPHSCTISARSACRRICCCARGPRRERAPDRRAASEDRRAPGRPLDPAAIYARDPAPPRMVERLRLPGRPRRRGDSVPPGSSSVADAFDAMSCDRPYRQRAAARRGAGRVRHFGGGQFDPVLAKEFVVLLEAARATWT